MRGIGINENQLSWSRTGSDQTPQTAMVLFGQTTNNLKQNGSVQELYIKATTSYDEFVAQLKELTEVLNTKGKDISTLKIVVWSDETCSYCLNTAEVWAVIIENIINENLPKLTTFDLSGDKDKNYKITQHTLKAMRDMLNIAGAGAGNIESINLSGNEIKDFDAVGILKEIAQHFPNIQSIDLRGNDKEWQNLVKSSLSKIIPACSFICDEYYGKMEWFSSMHS